MRDNKDFDILGVARTVVEFTKQFKDQKPDVIIYDAIHSASKPEMAIKALKRKCKRSALLLIVGEEQVQQYELFISLGVDGIILNRATKEELFEAIIKLSRKEEYFHYKVWMHLKDYIRTKKFTHQSDPVSDRNPVLSKRELSVLQMFCQGATYKEIGNELHISPRTVETHKKNILEKLNLKSKAEMIKFGFTHNLIQGN